MTNGTSIGMLLGMTLMTASAPTASAQSLTGLGFLPGGSSSVAHAVSADGITVVGSAGTPNGDRAFRWTLQGRMEDLGVLPGATRSEAFAVSGDGSVVVGRCTEGASGTNGRAFRWTEAGGMEDLGLLPGGSISTAQAVSLDGAVVVGCAEAPDGRRAFRWTGAGGMEDLGVLPLGGELRFSEATGVSHDGAVIAGFSTSSEHFQSHLFRWTSGGGMEDLGVVPGSWGWVEANAISGDGEMIVGYNYEPVPSGDDIAMRWTPSTGFELLEEWQGDHPDSQATAVNLNGAVIVGWMVLESFWIRTGAVRWQGGERAIIETELAAAGVNLTGWTLDRAHGVSADGRVIVGMGRHPTMHDEGWIATLPPACPADFNHNYRLDSEDIFDFLAAFFDTDFAADFNRSGTLDSQDFFDFLTAFFAGCP